MEGEKSRKIETKTESKRKIGIRTAYQQEKGKRSSKEESWKRIRIKWGGGGKERIAEGLARKLEREKTVLSNSSPKTRFWPAE